MKKSIIFAAVAMLTITNTFASGSVTTQQSTTTHGVKVDSLKKLKPADTAAEAEFFSPETVFPRVGISVTQIIREDLAITEFCLASTFSELVYPVITNIEVAENDLIIDAVSTPVMPLDFSIIDRVPQRSIPALTKCKVEPSL